MKKKSLNHNDFEIFLQNYEECKRGFYNALEWVFNSSKEKDALNYYDRFLNLIKQNSFLFWDVLYSLYSTTLESYRTEMFKLMITYAAWKGVHNDLSFYNQDFLSHYCEVDKTYQLFLNTFKENNIPTTFLEFSLFAPLELLKKWCKWSNSIMSKMTWAFGELKTDLEKQKKKQDFKNSLMDTLIITLKVVWYIVLTFMILVAASNH